MKLEEAGRPISDVIEIENIWNTLPIAYGNAARTYGETCYEIGRRQMLESMNSFQENLAGERMRRHGLREGAEVHMHQSNGNLQATQPASVRRVPELVSLQSGTSTPEEPSQDPLLRSAPNAVATVTMRDSRRSPHASLPDMKRLNVDTPVLPTRGVFVQSPTQMGPPPRPQASHSMPHSPQDSSRASAGVETVPSPSMPVQQYAPARAAGTPDQPAVDPLQKYFCEVARAAGRAPPKWNNLMRRSSLPVGGQVLKVQVDETLRSKILEEARMEAVTNGEDPIPDSGAPPNRLGTPIVVESSKSIYFMPNTSITKKAATGNVAATRQVVTLDTEKHAASQPILVTATPAGVPEAAQGHPESEDKHRGLNFGKTRSPSMHSNEVIPALSPTAPQHADQAPKARGSASDGDTTMTDNTPVTAAGGSSKGTDKRLSKGWVNEPIAVPPVSSSASSTAPISSLSSLRSLIMQSASDIMNQAPQASSQANDAGPAVQTTTASTDHESPVTSSPTRPAKRPPSSSAPDSGTPKRLRLNAAGDGRPPQGSDQRIQAVQMTVHWRAPVPSLPPAITRGPLNVIVPESRSPLAPGSATPLPGRPEKAQAPTTAPSTSNTAEAQTMTEPQAPTVVASPAQASPPVHINPGKMHVSVVRQKQESLSQPGPISLHLSVGQTERLLKFPSLQDLEDDIMKPAKYEYRLVCTRISTQRTRAWPPSGFFVEVNGEPIMLDRAPPVNGKLWLNNYLHQGQNLIQIAITTPPSEEYVINTELRIFESSLRLYRAVRQNTRNTIPKEEFLPLCRSVAANRDVELSVLDGEPGVHSDTITLSLLDPSTGARINTPVRGRACTHLNCFDLYTHLEGANPGLCPICGNSVRPGELRWDLGVEEVLGRVRGERGSRAIAVEVELRTGLGSVVLGSEVRDEG
ncbi:hypothetical protein YB2330_004768 [Saitoella coloradoensis]